MIVLNNTPGQAHQIVRPEIIITRRQCLILNNASYYNVLIFARGSHTACIKVLINKV